MLKFYAMSTTTSSSLTPRRSHGDLTDAVVAEAMKLSFAPPLLLEVLEVLPVDASARKEGP